jgi:antitoxin (DNA-binding transcriptional repressor) of toxin-antitoxin stability system
MKQVSIREVQHNLSQILKLTEKGEELQITRRGHVVARILPPKHDDKKVDWSGLYERALSIGAVASDSEETLSDIVIKSRDRF